MTYKYDSFLQPYNSDDKNLLIYDKDGLLKYTINPFSVINTQVRSNIVTISIKSGRTVLLDFGTSNNAISGLSILQTRIKDLTRDKSVHIDKQIENWVSNINSLSSTFSIQGSIIPSQDYTFDLGSSTYRWNNIYVKDALVASQSLFIGNVKLSSDENGLITGDQAVYNYDGTSTDTLITPEVGSVITMNVRPIKLSYKNGESLKVFNKEENFFEDPDYSEDSDYSYFVGRVDNYVPETGSLTLITNYTYNSGTQYSFWHIKLNLDSISSTQSGPTGPQGSTGPQGVTGNQGATGTIISSTAAPISSGSSGSYGETRFSTTGGTPYLYVYTDQWYRFIGATF